MKTMIYKCAVFNAIYVKVRSGLKNNRKCKRNIRIWYLQLNLDIKDSGQHQLAPINNFISHGMPKSYITW